MPPKSKGMKFKEDKPVAKINQRKKDSYLADDPNYVKFSAQLAKLGLELRDITGDGNCLFRAISDQIDGNESQHLKYRREICEYMRNNREDFEPFVVGLVDELDKDKKGKTKGADAKLSPFDSYVNNLEKSGTYGGNDGLVAFSRLYKLEINLHQLDQPIWKVNGSIELNPKQIHLSYHNGDHYSSVRQIGDDSSLPTNIRIGGAPIPQDKNDKDKKKTKNSYAYQYENSYNHYDNEDGDDDEEMLYKLQASEMGVVNQAHNTNELVEKIINVTNCFDLKLINDTLTENNNNIENAITAIMNKLAVNDAYGSDESTDDENESKGAKAVTKNKKTTLSKRDKKMLKKQRQMERQQNKVMELKKENFIKNDDKSANDKGSEDLPRNHVIANDDQGLNIVNVAATSI